MNKAGRLSIFVLVVGCLSEVGHAESPIPLHGRVAGGFVEPEGLGTLLVVDDERRASALIRIDDRGMQGSIELPPGRVGRSLTVLADGRFLLESEDATTMHDRPHHFDIVEIRGTETDTIWSWNSREAFPGVGSGNEHLLVIFSGDGRGWGTGHGSSFSFRRTGDPSWTTREEQFHVARELTDIGKWTIFSPGFVYLDSAGPVVAVPWNNGAFIVHFSEAASPVVRPILFDNGVEEYLFQWQWKERVLWAETSLYWKGYPLPDLGISGMDEEPIWVLDKDTAAPHPERGVVQVTAVDGRYRVEHAWRESAGQVEVRHASDWYRGEYVRTLGPPGGRRPGGVETALVAVSPRTGLFVSANGQHGVLVERWERGDGIRASFARVVDLRPTTPSPGLEADQEAEAAADRELIPQLAQ